MWNWRCSCSWARASSALARKCRHLKIQWQRSRMASQVQGQIRAWCMPPTCMGPPPGYRGAEAGSWDGSISKSAEHLEETVPRDQAHLTDLPREKFLAARCTLPPPLPLPPLPPPPTTSAHRQALISAPRKSHRSSSPSATLPAASRHLVAKPATSQPATSQQPRQSLL